MEKQVFSYILCLFVQIFHIYFFNVFVLYPLHRDTREMNTESMEEAHEAL